MEERSLLMINRLLWICHNRVDIRVFLRCLTEFPFDNGVACDWNTLTIDLGESTFVDQFADRLEIWISPGHIRLNDTEHVDGSLVKFDKDSIVDLL